MSYTLERILGRGTFGEVWQVRDEQDGSKKALKILVRGVESSLSEIDVLFRVINPQLIKGYDINIANGRVSLVEQLIAGDMGSNIFTNRQFQNIPNDEKLNIYNLLAVDCCRGLSCLYRAGYIHLDIKPENILFSYNNDRWFFYIGDYGLAFPRNMDMELTYEVGTPLFFPPEYKSLPIKLTESTPSWALGFSLIEIITGENPLLFDYDTPQEYVDEARIILRNHFHGWDNVLKPRIDRLTRCLLRLVEPDPERRITPSRALYELNANASICDFSNRPTELYPGWENDMRLINSNPELTPKMKLLTLSLMACYMEMRKTNEVTDELTNICINIVKSLCLEQSYIDESSLNVIKSLNGKLLNPDILDLTDEQATLMVSSNDEIEAFFLL